MKKNRIWELDFFRGFAIIMVVIDHAMYDFCCLFPSWKSSGGLTGVLYRIGHDYLYGETRAFWRPAFLFLFFTVSGLCTAFSHNNFLRGLRLFIVSALLSLVTYCVQKITGENSFILFGVLHCLAVVTLCYAACDACVNLVFKWIEKKTGPKDLLKKIVRTVLFLGLSVLFFFINKNNNVLMTSAFATGATVEKETALTGLFFYGSKWWTADYFPLFPFIAFFFLGAGLTEVLYPKRRSLFPALDGKWHYVFSFPGRYSLWIYLAGQVVVIGLCYLLTMLV